jgi:hypothetical protein
VKAFRAVLLLLCLLAAFPASAAQETIAISDSLAANADELKVTMGSQWFGQINKWRVGDYAVVSSKLASTQVRTHSNLFQTKVARQSTTTFSFVLRNTPADSARVTAVRRVMDNSSQEMKVSKSVSLGSNELLQAADSCTAIIVVGGDTTETWTLVKASTTAPELGYRAVLTNGARTIVLNPVRSGARDDHARHASFFSRLTSHVTPPAMGYEFMEAGQSVCALQTFGGISKGDGRMVWMRRDLAARLKLVLAAAITTVLQVESSGTGLEPSDEE